MIFVSSREKSLRVTLPDQLYIVRCLGFGKMVRISYLFFIMCSLKLESECGGDSGKCVGLATSCEV